MEENKKNLSSGPWWRGAVALMGDVSTWIVAPIILALVFGKMLDTHYGTKPIIFLIFISIAFLASCLKIFYIVKNYIKKIQDTETKK